MKERGFRQRKKGVELAVLGLDLGFFEGFLEKLIQKEEIKRGLWMNFGRSLMSMNDGRR